MHRLHEDDLAGHVMAQEDWDVVRLPAIADADELHPGREPAEMLAQLRRTLGEYNFAGQYQQAPSPQGGGMVKAAWFKNYAANELPEKFDQICNGRGRTLADHQAHARGPTDSPRQGRQDGA